jgi:hypothetical protein
MLLLIMGEAVRGDLSQLSSENWSQIKTPKFNDFTRTREFYL